LAFSTENSPAGKSFWVLRFSLKISEVTGARCYTLDDSQYLPMITRHIGAQLRNQYVLAYRPNNAKDDGKWRKIKVKLTLLPRSLPHLRVHAKTGYYAPSQ
jgi:Ca-activated chloride channel family protein